jgi:hypothetical protein
MTTTEHWPQICANCRFFWRVPNAAVDDHYGRCRRFPPVRVSQEQDGFPTTYENQWCGEYIGRAAK